MRISSFEIHRQASAQLQSLGADVARTQLHISSGKRIVDPSDDPVGAAKAIQIKQSMGDIDRYLKNVDRVDVALSLEDSVLASVTEVLHRIEELTIQAGSGIQTDEDREFIANEMRVRYEELVSLANTRSADGQYLFAGFKSNAPPFEANAQSVQYLGDSGQRQLQIGRGQSIAASDAGNLIFMRGDNSEIKASGNNHLVFPEDQNASLGSINVIDQELASAFAPEKLVIQFRPLSEGGGLPNFSIVRQSDQQPIDGFVNFPFQSGVPVTVAGFSFSVDGTPTEGDRFVVEPHQQQGILETVRRIAFGLDINSTGDTEIDAQTRQGLINSTLSGLEAGLTNVLETRTSIGARLNTMDAVASLHQDVKIQMQDVLSRIQDLDFAKAVSDLTYQSFVLQAAQQSFVRISGLSLFNAL